MAWTFGTFATAGDSAGTTLVVTRPASIATGDWQVLQFYIETTGLTPAFTNGSWTLIRSDSTGTNFQVFLYISRYAGEGTTFTISWGGTNTWRTAQIARYLGGDTTSASDSGASTGTGHPDNTLATTVNFDTFTPVADNCLVIYAGGNFAGRTYAAASGTTPTLTERTDGGGLVLGDGVQTTATAVGARTSAMAGGGAQCLGQMFAITLTGAAAAQQNPFTRTQLNSLLAA